MSAITAFLFSEHTAFIWNAEDAMKLRTDFRIVGAMIGSLPTHPRQNISLGLPLKLMPEESTLLLQEGVLKLKRYHNLLSSLSETDQEKCRELFKKLQTEEHIRQEYLYKQSNQKCKSQSSNTSTTLSSVASSNQKAAGFSPVVCIHTEDVFVGSIQEKQGLEEHTKGIEQKESESEDLVEWKWPQSKEEVMKYRVFSDLWHKGYYLTSGLKYGGEYLIYPGDPNGVHSQYIAKVMEWDKTLPASSLVTAGRLGGKVKKHTLICSVNPDEGSVHYLTLYWSGMS